MRNITNANTNQVNNSKADLHQNIVNSNSNNINTFPKTISLELLQEKLRPIYFEEVDSKLSENNMRILDDYASLLNQCDFIIVIKGHADAENLDNNFQLSRFRANLVYKYLLDKGISEDRFNVVNFGGERNIKLEKSPYNRRVEFKVIKNLKK